MFRPRAGLKLGNHNSTVNKPLTLLTPFVVPAALVVAAALLTVPWSYLVLKAAYDRDVTENARALARRVEIQRSLTLSQPGMAIDLLFPLIEQARDKAMADALRSEIASDPSVQTLIFYNILYLQSPVRGAPPSALVKSFIVRKHGSGPSDKDREQENQEEEARATERIDRLTREQLITLRNQGIIRVDESSSKIFLIPWIHSGQLQGVTYVELSNAALSNDFWKREWGLFWQVIAWSTSGILALSAVGIFAYRLWQRASHVQQRSELAQQGLSPSAV